MAANRPRDRRPLLALLLVPATVGVLVLALGGEIDHGGLDRGARAPATDPDDRAAGEAAEARRVVPARAPDRPRSGAPPAASAAAPDDLPAGAATVLEGRLLGSDGAPAAGCSVELFEYEHEQPAPLPFSSAATDADGRFAFSTDDLPRSDAALVAVRPGERPAFLRLAADALTSAPVTLRFEAGHVLAGRVTCNGRAEPGRVVDLTRHDAGAVVIAFGVDFPQEIHVWRDGRPELAAASARTDDDGGYAFTGLGPGAHELSLAARRDAALHPAAREAAGADPWARLVVVDDVRKQIAVAPRRDADFDREVAWHLLRTRMHAGPPVRLAKLVLFRTGDALLHETVFQTGQSLLLEVPAGRSLEGLVEGAGLATVRLDLAPAAAGSRAILPVTLHARHPLEIAFTLPAAFDARTTALEVTFERLQGEDASLATALGVPRRPPLLAARRDGAFRLVDPPLEPGLHRAHIVPKGAPCFPVLVRLDVPETGRLDVALDPAPAARLEITLVPPRAEGHHGVTWRLRAEDGETLHERRYRVRVSGRSSSILDLTFDDAEPVFLPGTHRLELDVEGRGRHREDIELRAGETLALRLPVER